MQGAGGRQQTLEQASSSLQYLVMHFITSRIVTQSVQTGKIHLYKNSRQTLQVQCLSSKTSFSISQRVVEG